ncbi:MAG: AMP-binding protein [Desulfobacter sp.]
MDKQPCTIPGLLAHRARTTPDDTAFYHKQSHGWQAITWTGFYRKALCLARALAGSGLGPGDVLAVLLPNTPEWEQAQHGGFLAGCTVAGLDMNDSRERLNTLLKMLRPKALVVMAVDDIPGQTGPLPPSIRLILTAAPGSGTTYAQDLAPGRTVRISGLDGFAADPPDTALPGVTEDQDAVRIFTSGTTGPPKSIGFTHGQLVFAATTISDLLHPFLPARARSACWLPLSGPFQRMINYCGLIMNARTFLVADPRQVVSLAREIQPHFMAGVPRFYEKLHDGIQHELNRRPNIVRQLIARCEALCMADDQSRQAGRPISPVRAGLCVLARALVFRGIRKILGGHIRFLFNGSAPLSPAIARVLTAWGWPLLDAYGVSENILPMAMNTPARKSLGSVGIPLPGNTIRIARDGEILVKGKGVAKTGMPLTRDGYLKTGDTGILDPNGFLYLNGRKADTFKLSTGRKIAPQDMETALKTIPGVDHGVISGAGKKYTTALLNITDRAWQSRVAAAGAPALARQCLYEDIRQACQSFPAYARPKAVAIVHTPFGIDTGELTPSLKVRRRFVLEKYAHEPANCCHHGNGTPRAKIKKEE